MGSSGSLSTDTLTSASDMLAEIDDGNIVLRSQVPARSQRDSPLPGNVHEDVRAALERSGVQALYEFQEHAVAAVLAGEDVVLAGGTGSGKSLCYQVPMLELLRRDPRSTALYIAPTKALAQDQARRLRAIGARWCAPVLYDGDTPTAQRSRIRRSARVVLTNPDMLSSGILPNHAEWNRFLARLRLVIVDESHVYRGVFGSNVAQVMRRLARICRQAGSAPVLVGSSATIGNPVEHFALLTGRGAAALIGDAGAPSAGRDLVLWNPSWDDDLESRDSALGDATRIYCELLKGGYPTIVFARTRKACELIHSFAVERLRSGGEDALAERIAPYRAGYTPEERRRTEADLAAGRLMGVVATNALELGIDIGSLDACVCVTWPGSMTSLWQQWGRAGRHQRGIGVLVAGDDALDQFFMHQPEMLLERDIERAVISTSNMRIVVPHVAAAAAELPLSAADHALYGGVLPAAMEELRSTGLLSRHGETASYIGRDHPAGAISLRSTAAARFAIVDVTTGALLGDVDATRAATTVHPGAVYLHRGGQFLVGGLDLSQRLAVVEPSTVPWYTLPKMDTEIRVLKELEERQSGALVVARGAIDVREQLVAFQRKHRTTQAVIDLVAESLPPLSYDTEALWFAPPAGSLDGMDEEAMLGALHAAEHALISMLPLVAMCDRADIGGLSTNWHDVTGGPCIFIYDGHPGGIGITQTGFHELERWLQLTEFMLRGCPCDHGCPSCVQSPKCGNLNEHLNKAGALSLVARLREEACSAP